MLPVDASSPIWEPYREYKTSTNYFLEWLWCQYRLIVTDAAQTHTFKSTSEILLAAKVIQEANCAVPVTVIAALRKSIAKRRAVLEVYQGLQTADVEHGHFLKRLETVCEILVPLMSQNAPSLTEIQPEKAATFTTPNPYSPLPVTVEDEPEETADVYEAAEPAPPRVEEPAVIPSTKSRIEWLKDDLLVDVIEGLKFLEQFAQVRICLKRHWADAATGKIPIPIAAWLTNEAFHNIKMRIPYNFIHAMDIIISTAIAALKRSPGSKLLPAAVPALQLSGYLWLLEGLASGKKSGYRELVKECTRLMEQDNPDLPRGKPNIKPAEPWSPDQISIEVIPEILKNMREDLSSRAVAAIEEVHVFAKTPGGLCEPFFAEARDLAADPKTPPTEDLLVSLNILLISSLSFFWPAPDGGGGDDDNEDDDDGVPGPLNHTNPRLSSLRLALEIRASLDPVIAVLADAPDPGPGVRNWVQTTTPFRDALTGYASERRFDLYHELPWTAGSHMAEMLYQAQYLGNLIFHYGAVIPGTLHLYNALRRVSGLSLAAIPLLDDLCELFIDNAFLGSLPTANFLSHYRRAVYGSKVSKTPQTSGRLANAAGTRPRDTWFRGAFWVQKRNRHVPSLCLASRMFDVPAGGPPQKEPALLHRLSDMYKAASFAENTKRARAVVMEDFTGPRCFAAVDLFSVFMVCSRVMRKFAQLARPDLELVSGGYPEGAGDLDVAEFLVEMVLKIMVDHLEDRGYKSLRSSPGLKYLKKAMEEVDRRLTLKDFKWNI